MRYTSFHALAVTVLLATPLLGQEGTLTMDAPDEQQEKESLRGYDILTYHSSHTPEHALISRNCEDELELSSALTNIDGSVTSCGSWGTQHYFKPTTDIATIYRRQQAIKTLLEKPEVLQQIRMKCADIRDSLSYALSYYVNSSEQEEPAGRELYYNTLGMYIPSLNYSPKALGIGVHCMPVIGTGLNASIPLLFKSVGQAQTYFTRPKNTWSALIPTPRECSEGFTRGAKAYVTHLSPRTHLTRAFDDPEAAPSLGWDSRSVLSGGDSYRLFATTTGSWIGGLLGISGHYFWDIYSGISIYQGCSELSRRYQEIHDLYHVTFHVSRIIRRSREIHTLLAQHLPQELVSELPTAELINAEHVSDNATSYLDSLLASHTFAEGHTQRGRAPHRRKPRNKYATGKVLATHQLLCDSQKPLTQTLEYIGAVDALAGMAQTYRDFKREGYDICFTSFDAERSTPYIALEGFWTPLLPVDKAVGSDITLDTQNAIFTGPNGIGKSTAMKGIAHCVALSHTFGIAPAATAHMSRFDHIGTYLNIREDTQEGLSSFMAEKKRVDEFYNEIPRLEGNTFYIVDEPFRGTFADEAEKRVRQFGEFVDQYPNVTMLLATHFAQPTQLANEHRYANYHIGINENHDNTFTLTYRLKPGVLDWWFNDPDKRSHFVDWISDHIAAQKSA